MQLKLSRYCCSVTFMCIVKPCSYVPFASTAKFDTVHWQRVCLIINTVLSLDTNANVKYERSLILLVNAYSKKLDSAIEFSQLSLSIVGTIVFNFVALTNSI